MEQAMEPVRELDESWPTTIKPIINVTGSFDPGVFTSEISLTPTETARAGDPRTPHTPLLKFAEDSWRMNLGERESLDIEVELDRLLAVLIPICEKFRTTVEAMGLSAEAAFVVTMSRMPYPAVSLRPDQIEQLAKLGMSLDIDVM
ncbi:MAG: DUF4279 domain-containing protein [Segniliparus sp.]|uniref:DUF4279 domain-containing protein n=1 Tax=Segniliparus sp. TaxID=2804064 RepID=UPI003F2C3CB3